ncbi:baculoviral IAP repeat-containing protein 7-B-like isoform X2 [Argopecten irradians]
MTSTTLGATFNPSDTGRFDRAVTVSKSDDLPMDKFCEQYRKRRGLPSIGSSVVTPSSSNAEPKKMRMSNGKDTEARCKCGQRFDNRRVAPLGQYNKVSLRSKERTTHLTLEFFRECLLYVQQRNALAVTDTSFLRDQNKLLPEYTQLQVYMVHNHREQLQSAGIAPVLPQNGCDDGNRNEVAGHLREQGLQTGGSERSLSDDERSQGLSAGADEDKGTDTTSTDEQNPQFTEICKREETFVHWEKSDPELLVNAGFYFTGEKDIVRCFHCDIGIADWEPTDDPWVDHARYSPDCDFLKREKGQKWIHNIQAEWQKVYKPKHPEYQRIYDRQKSFENEQWQQDNATENPEHLANAGFFLDGDRIRCHYCDCIMREGLGTDESLDGDSEGLWIKHAKTFPFCKYLLNQKGADFVRTHKASNSAMERPNHYLPVAAGPEGHVSSLSCEQEFGIREERNPMWTAAAQSLLAMNYSKEYVTMAIHIFLSREHSGKEIREFHAGNLVDIIQEYEELVSENKRLKARFQCRKCHDREVSRIALPCGHLVACEECVADVDTCGICHRGITDKLRIFFC